MAASLRRWRLPGLIAAVFITCGCNLAGLTYFLFNGKDVHPPECAELAAPAKETKILILASLGRWAPIAGRRRRRARSSRWTTSSTTCSARSPVSPPWPAAPSRPSTL